MLIINTEDFRNTFRCPDRGTLLHHGEIQKDFLAFFLPFSPKQCTCTSKSSSRCFTVSCYRLQTTKLNTTWFVHCPVCAQETPSHQHICSRRTSRSHFPYCVWECLKSKLRKYLLKNKPTPSHTTTCSIIYVMTNSFLPQSI